MKRAIFSLTAAFVLGLAAVGCDEGGITPPPPDGPMGSLTIVTSTTGGFLAAAYTEYTYRIDGGREAELGPNETNVQDLAAGAHVLEIAVPRDCEVQGENPRLVNVVEDEDVQVEFEITCGRSESQSEIRSPERVPRPEELVPDERTFK